MTEPLTGAAVEYAIAGWRVLPVHPTTKRPLTRHGVLDASNNTEIVALTWRPLWLQGASIATPTGDGLLVIDIDPRNGGKRKSWMPATREVSTQSGGLHLHYRIDEDIKSRANLFGPGIDSKCSGGYVLIPPSPGYEWADLREPATIRAADLERWVDTSYSPTGATGSVARRRPQDWRRGMIHDQVVAWAAYLAGDLDDRDTTAAVCDLVRAAQAAGVPIDNANDHIGKAIQWVLQREAN
jgi:hypothetical protein